jgi:hypothetical protein
MPSTYEPIATTTVSGSSTTTITFSSIPSTYTDLVLIADATASTSGQGMNLYLNGDAGTNYSSTRLYSNGSTVTSDRQSNGNFINFAIGGFNNGQAVIAQIMDYKNTTTNKTMLLRQTNPTAFVGALVGLWRSTAAITTVEIIIAGGNYVAGSTFTLYGIKAA